MKTFFGMLNFMASATISPFMTQDCKLLSRTELTSKVTNPVILLRFELPESTSLENDVFHHVSITAVINGRSYRRNYTPITTSETKGYFEIMVKVYPDGCMGNYLNKLQVGQTVNVAPPRGKLTYIPGQHESIGIICGGVGVAPMIHLIRKTLHSHPNTNITLLFCNQTEQDIIMKKELDQLAEQHSNFKVYYVLSQPHEEWDGIRGRVNEWVIETYLPSSNTHLTVFCGPKPMNRTLKAIFSKQGRTNAYKV
ncbi:cytochrome-b5 reductase [Acrasis kona]|uniref:Cytochrome-b5 reductase n=1 Tax=Acrasis kona TaxID=1008807 RepID=A0AAW2Z6B0_9EUKA